MFKFLTPEELYEIFKEYVDIHDVTKSAVQAAMNAAYNKGLEDCRTLHLGERV